jgi:hypothetical protein
MNRVGASHTFDKPVGRTAMAANKAKMMFAARQ